MELKVGNSVKGNKHNYFMGVAEMLQHDKVKTVYYNFTEEEFRWETYEAKDLKILVGKNRPQR